MLSVSSKLERRQPGQILGLDGQWLGLGQLQGPTR